MKVDKDISLLFSLLRKALWKSEESLPSELPEEVCHHLLSLASMQAVMGLVTDALIRNNVRMPQKCVFEIIGTLEQIKQQGRKIDEGVVKLHYLLAEHKIGYRVMKGQAVAKFYPVPLLRQSGDIDYYCMPNVFERSLGVVREAWEVMPEIHKSEKHADYEYQGIRYEPHYILTDLHRKKYNDYLVKLINEDPGAEVEINGIYVKTFSPTLHTLYIFLHLFFHLVEVGVGLRQFCDLALMLRAGVDHSALKNHLETLGMVRAFKACEFILTDCLGLQEQYLPYKISPIDRKYGKRMLGVVLYRGNMGHYNKRNGWSGLGHQLESACIKMSHFVKFYCLSPTYLDGLVTHRLFENGKS